MYKKRGGWEKHLANRQGTPTPPGIALPVTNAIVITPRVITPPPVSPRVITPPVITPPSVPMVVSNPTVPQKKRTDTISQSYGTHPSPPLPPPSYPRAGSLPIVASIGGQKILLKSPIQPKRPFVPPTQTEGEPSPKRPRVLPSVFATTGIVASNAGAGEGTSGTASSSAGASSSGASSSASASSHPGPATGPLGGGVVHTTASTYSIFQFLLYLGECFEKYTKICLEKYPFLSDIDIVLLVNIFNGFCSSCKLQEMGYRNFKGCAVSFNLGNICYKIECKYPHLFPYREILTHMVSDTLPFYFFWIAYPMLPSNRNLLKQSSLFQYFDSQEFVVARKLKWEGITTQLAGLNLNTKEGRRERSSLVHSNRLFLKQYEAKKQLVQHQRQEIITLFRGKLDQRGIDHSDIR